MQIKGIYRKLILVETLILSSICNFSACQVDSTGSGHSIQFDGIDDYINLGDIYDNLALPISISAWIRIDSPPGYLYPIFNSQDNLPIYNGITFTVSTTSISIQYGDGRGEGSSAFRRGKGAIISDITGKWVTLLQT